MTRSLPAEQIAELRKTHYNAVLLQYHLIHEELATLRVQPDRGLPVHEPGQFATLGLGYWEPRAEGCQEEHLKPGQESKLVRRAYSISHPILDTQGQLVGDRPPWLEFYVVLVRHSEKAEAPALTPRLFSLVPGSRLFMGDKITGHYTLEQVKQGDTILFLSTGTGEAPHNYMLWELLRRGHTGRMLSACCVRFRQDLAYLAVHEQLMKRYPNYTYLSLTTREADTIQQKVYIQDLISSGELESRLGQTLDPDHTHVFLCGNPKMIGVKVLDRTTNGLVYPKPLGVIELLEKRGFQADQAKTKGNIHFEEYW
jgi:ferredoxin--NADP+ reductase